MLVIGLVNYSPKLSNAIMLGLKTGKSTELSKGVEQLLAKLSELLAPRSV
jgi:hypothetical protein